MNLQTSELDQLCSAHFLYKMIIIQSNNAAHCEENKNSLSHLYLSDISSILLTASCEYHRGIIDHSVHNVSPYVY